MGLKKKGSDRPFYTTKKGGPALAIRKSLGEVITPATGKQKGGRNLPTGREDWRVKTSKWRAGGSRSLKNPRGQGRISSNKTPGGTWNVGGR